ncbi:hypothetical protein KR215_004962 [Drosophila sulfurigaster]|nr:hypothetical protein KR215_004962 [Drosophila sulfurigaster]
MSRPSYLQEQLLYQQHHPAANIKRLRQQALPIYGRSYSLEEQTDGHFVPVYSKFIYPQQQQLHPQQLLHRPLGLGLQDSLNSLNSDCTDYDYGGGAYILEEQPPPAAASTEHVVRNLNALGRLLELLQRWPLPRLSFNTACICSLIIIFIAPRSCAQSLLFPAFRLFFGTLYPAYASYKAVRTKNVKEYVKWMMYWIVFAFFTCIETFTDIFLSWFPFYYEVKVVIVLWLLSPATKGSSTLYRKFVHPMLTRREQEIDEYLNQARERGYSAVLQLGSKGVNYATNVIMQTAIKGGGNLVQTIKRSYSLSDLSEPDMHRTQDELDEVMMSTSVMMRPQPARLMRQRHQTPVGRSASGTRHSTGMYFTEVDVSSPSPSGSAKHAGDFNYNIRSTDDISSGYSSAEPVSVPMSSGLSRTSSMTNASKARVKSKRNEQLLEDVRAEAYLDNERYFQESKTHDDIRKQLHLQILESEEDNEDNAGNADVSEDEDSFHEALPLEDDAESLLPSHSLDADKEKEEVSDNEESFKEALGSNSDNLNQANPEEVDQPAQESDQSSVDPFLLVVTESSLEKELVTPPVTNDRNRPVSPRELLATLEEIKHSFRAQLETESPQISPLRPKALHAKGRAPPPPLPPRKDSRDTVSIASNTSQQSERSKSGIGQLFKNIKDNVLRSSSSSKANQPHKDGDVGLSVAKETRI